VSEKSNINLQTLMDWEKKLPKQVLDDLPRMLEIDKSNMMTFCTNSAEQYKASAKNAERIDLNYPKPRNVIIAGMGGSAIGGEILKDFTRGKAKKPIEISREYTLPSYADKNSLVVLASYSGDTEETLSALVDAVNRGCMIFCLSSGGKLIQYARKLNLPHLQVQAGMPPRGALPHMLIPLLKCLERTKLIPSFSEEFSEALNVLHEVSDENQPAVPSDENEAKKLALNLFGLTPAVYGFGIYRGVALRYKQQFNENAKVPAKWEYFSELNHNETMGWESAGDLAKRFGVVFLRDEAEPVEIRSRIETTKELMQSSVKMFEVWTEGKGNLAKMLGTILLGDFASVYLALLRGVDPTPVKTVSVMKERIEKNGVKENIIGKLERLASK
jgi:glucose/mannose-6-phosphate isomerase